MTEEEFSGFIEVSLENYVRALARNFKRPIDEVRDESGEQVKGLLKDGLNTKGHFLFDAVDKESDDTVGNIWVSVDEEKERAFLYDILVHERFRGRGYGRKSLELLEETLRGMGVSSIGLHVFADNRVAISPYEKLGYETASFNMHKEL